VHQATLNKTFETLVLLLAPMAPHMGEELWAMMEKQEKTVNDVAWPVYDEKALQLANASIVVQVNGKLRGKFDVPVDCPEAELKEIVLADEKIKAHLEGKEIKRFIIVPNKIVNIVV
jgi:leucyl-tRNA synthetase